MNKDLIGIIVVVLGLPLLAYLLAPTIVERIDEQDRAHTRMIEAHAASVAVK